MELVSPYPTKGDIVYCIPPFQTQLEACTVLSAEDPDGFMNVENDENVSLPEIEVLFNNSGAKITAKLPASSDCIKWNMGTRSRQPRAPLNIGDVQGLSYAEAGDLSAFASSSSFGTVSSNSSSKGKKDSASGKRNGKASAAATSKSKAKGKAKKAKTIPAAKAPTLGARNGKPRNAKRKAGELEKMYGSDGSSDVDDEDDDDDDDDDDDEDDEDDEDEEGETDSDYGGNNKISINNFSFNNSDTENEQEDDDEESSDGDDNEVIDNDKTDTRYQKSAAARHLISKADITEVTRKGLQNLCIYEKLMKPFVTPKVSTMLLKLQKEYGVQKKAKDTNVQSAEYYRNFLDNIPALSQPKSLNPICKMRDYQLKGYSWLRNQYELGVNSILADEMGLGKTLQTISLITHLLHEANEETPFLVVVPLSVLFNWVFEFRKWSPSIKVIRCHTNDDTEAKRLRGIISNKRKCEVVVTTYDQIKTGRMARTFRSMYFNGIVLDEGHRIKNEQSTLSKACGLLKGKFRLVLTGTPIQNNLHESWAILNFLNPSIFTDSSPFDEAFDLQDKKNGDKKVEVDRDVLSKAHYLLRPFLLRRLKGEVEQNLPMKLETKVSCPMQPMQKFWIQRLLYRQRTALQSIEKTTEFNVGVKVTSLNSLLAQLRKAANHPYLFPGAETLSLDGKPTKEIVEASGKMKILDKMLPKLQKKGHRVVLFSQHTQTLDIISDFLDMRMYKFTRLDGSTNRVMREVLVNQFNRYNSTLFIFLLSTRAGGEGINLTSADTVILFDSDWNPQVDNQAMARVHRIGQTKPVHVYRLVTEGSVEERIVQRAQKKLFLDGMVNRGSTNQALSMDEETAQQTQDKEDADEETDPRSVFTTLKFGWNAVFRAKHESKMISDEDMDRMLDRTRATSTDVKLTKVKKGDKKGKAKKGNGKNGSEKEQEDTNVDDSDDNGNSNAEALEEGQQFSLADFDESAPMVSIRDFEGELIDSSDTIEDISSAFRKSGHDLKNIMNSKRERKSRLQEIEVEGVGTMSVLHSNDYDMSKGEPSIFDKEEKGYKKTKLEREQTNVSTGFATNRGRQIAGRDYHHQDICQVCWDGGELLVCDNCPAAYHHECLGMKSMPKSNKWSCPLHACSKCARRATQAGFLFRCEICPHAYCEDCLPVSDIHITGISERLSKLGYRNPGSSCYVLCSDLCIDNALAEGYTDLPDDILIKRDAQLANASPSSKTKTDNDADAADMGSPVGYTTMNKQGQLVHHNVAAVESCKLRDIRHRLGRLMQIDTELKAKYVKLGDVFGFQDRWTLTSPNARSAFRGLLETILNPFGAELYDEEKKVVSPSRDGRGNAEKRIAKKAVDPDQIAETQEEPEEAAIDEDEAIAEKALRAVLRYKGIPMADMIQEQRKLNRINKVTSEINNSNNAGNAKTDKMREEAAEAKAKLRIFNEKMHTAFMDATRFLTTVRKDYFIQLCKLVSIFSYNYNTFSKKEKEDFKQRGIAPMPEPKFREIKESNINRAFAEEAMAAFLVTLLPQNTLIPASDALNNVWDEDEMESESDVAEPLFLITRKLESHLFYAHDSNSGYFTGLSAMQGKYQGMKSWSKNIGPLKSEMFNECMAPARAMWTACSLHPHLFRQIQRLPAETRRLLATHPTSKIQYLLGLYKPFIRNVQALMQGEDSDAFVSASGRQVKRTKRLGDSDVEDDDEMDEDFDNDGNDDFSDDEDDEYTKHQKNEQRALELGAKFESPSQSGKASHQRNIGDVIGDEIRRDLNAFRYYVFRSKPTVEAHYPKADPLDKLHIYKRGWESLSQQEKRLWREDYKRFENENKARIIQTQEAQRRALEEKKHEIEMNQKREQYKLVLFGGYSIYAEAIAADVSRKNPGVSPTVLQHHCRNSWNQLTHDQQRHFMNVFMDRERNNHARTNHVLTSNNHVLTSNNHVLNNTGYPMQQGGPPSISVGPTMNTISQHGSSSMGQMYGGPASLGSQGNPIDLNATTVNNIGNMSSNGNNTMKVPNSHDQRASDAKRAVAESIRNPIAQELTAVTDTDNLSVQDRLAMNAFSYYKHHTLATARENPMFVQGSPEDVQLQNDCGRQWMVLSEAERMKWTSKYLHAHQVQRKQS